jgi:hypothetical protein
LFSTHAILASALKVPEIALTKVEAKTLAEAAAEVAKYYPYAIDPKTVAWVNLATCAGLTYGPRIYMARTRIDAERRAKKAKPVTPSERPQETPARDVPESNVFIMPGMPGGMGPVGDSGGAF